MSSESVARVSASEVGMVPGTAGIEVGLGETVGGHLLAEVASRLAAAGIKLAA